MRRLLPLVVILCLQVVPPHDAKSASWGPRVAPGGQPAQPVATLTRVEQMIAMRDGVRLYTQIYTPQNATTALPIVFQRTPYGVGQNTAAGVATALVDLPADGYVIVLQDIRGRFKSEGDFVMLRQPRDRKDPKAIDESTDTYDTIEWLL